MPNKEKVKLTYIACLNEVTDGYAFPRYIMAVPDPILHSELFDKYQDEIAKNPYNADTRACYINIGIRRS